jgi:hypothetical protein
VGESEEEEAVRVTYYPFFSQQHKTHGKFLLGSDSGVKLYAYMAEQSVKAGWDVRIVLPYRHQCEDAIQLPCEQICAYFAINNLDRRLQWDPDWLKVVADTDIVITQHEFMAYPLRCLHPKLKIISECGLLPEVAYQQTAGMFELAWRAADAVHCNSRTIAKHIPNKTFIWQFGYDDNIVDKSPLPRNIDVLFNARASVTNYTNHELFLKAFVGGPLKYCITDPTNYLKLRDVQFTRSRYIEILHSSKVVVSMHEGGYGGYALREAMACGAIPVTLRLPEYEELLGSDWPYYCEKSVDSLYGAVKAAMQGWPGTRQDVLNELRKSSYSEAWKQAKEDIESIA